MGERSAENLSALREVSDLLADSGAESATLCFQCGLCDSVCPWNLVKDFMVRRLVREAQFGLAEIESDDVWQCASCGKCPARCPRGVGIVDVMLAMRRIASEYDIQPRGIRHATASLTGDGNPWGGTREGRADWARGLSVNEFTEGTELLYFPCCTQCYESRTTQSAVATVRILERAGVDFGILGSEEVCCGESIRKTGEEALYKSLAKQNIKSFIDNGVRKILVSSPHCYQTFKSEYPDFKVGFEVLHVSEYLLELLREGRLELAREYPKKVAYHDPCYLGRHNGIYREPREILERIPGLELVELNGSHQESLCCGGGAGRIWMETPKEERLSDLRIEQAVEAGAEVLATSCPYCILNFEDSLLTSGREADIAIKDLTEILQEAI
jgi:Fe-S oxidoreductase